MLLKLHSWHLCLCPNFKKTPKACKSKFSEVFKAYKDDKQANSISGEVRHTCKFYNAMDTWYHQNGAVMKHISGSSSENVDIGCGLQEIKKEESKETSCLLHLPERWHENLFIKRKLLTSYPNLWSIARTWRRVCR